MIGYVEIFGLLGLGALFLPLAIFWVVQFVQLMLLEDDLFPGSYDKLAWMAAFVLVAPLAPFAFLLWKHARLAEREPTETKDGATGDEV